MSLPASPDTLKSSDSGSRAQPIATDDDRSKTTRIDPDPLNPGAGIFARITQIEHHSEFSGPLPPPEVLRQYEATTKGAADRIIAMAEEEQRFTHDMTRRALQAQSDALRVRMQCATLVVIAVLATTAWLGYVGAHAAAAVLGGGTLVGLASVFVISRQKPETEEKPPENKKAPGGRDRPRRKKRRG
jgi:uncharacterized membrane protein